jgi:protein phosphatase
MTTVQPLTSRYIWAAARQATGIPTDRLVEDRYHVIAPQLWLDTKPEVPPGIISPIPYQALAYAHLYRYKLHLPQLHGFCSLKQSHETIEIPLLDNIPIDSEGKLLPSLVEAWSTATPLYQAYWLWQAIDLWAPLAGTGVLASLAVMENLRVDGWCLRLCELIADRTMADRKVTLAQIGTLWLQTLPGAAPEIVDRLQALLLKMQAEQASLRDVARILNLMLLEQAAKLPIDWQIAGGTDAGVTPQHNEDSYYPSPLELTQDPTGGKIAIICDGIAGHEGGEVASQLAVKLLKIEAQTLLEDLSNNRELVTPEQICNAIAAIVRVVNNTITAQNHSQGREDTRRMGTTMVMAIQVNQRVRTDRGFGQSNEIYIAHIGDSRAYWITPQRCQLLTVDDDIATREVKQGRDVPWHSAHRPDATALTQALGMKSGESIHPTVQRFMAIEDGILLLCSDGLSDRQLVESSWQDYASRILQTEMPLTEAVRSWLALAHRKNGDDNISLVLMSAQVSRSHSHRISDRLVPIARQFRPVEELKPDRIALGSRFKFSSPIAVFVFVTSLVGLLAAGAIAMTLLYPDWIDNLRYQISPNPTAPVEASTEK